MDEYRCTETIDLEDFLNMTQEPTKVKATIFWKSGRTQEIISDLNKGGDIKKSFVKIIDDNRKFPTVEGVQVTKF